MRGYQPVRSARYRANAAILCNPRTLAEPRAFLRENFLCDLTFEPAHRISDEGVLYHRSLQPGKGYRRYALQVSFMVMDLFSPPALNGMLAIETASFLLMNQLWRDGKDHAPESLELKIWQDQCAAEELHVEPTPFYAEAEKLRSRFTSENSERFEFWQFVRALDKQKPVRAAQVRRILQHYGIPFPPYRPRSYAGGRTLIKFPVQNTVRQTSRVRRG
ncbi:MAG TPA: hypothetical protein VJK52_00800 [Candidatus Nanoarchaeia archaeon]|nr:hypothetical protein [Candidatus Nanoarchaeia archaeon]